MKLDKVISQLEDLMQHCEEFRDKGDSEDIWVKDVQALDVAIKELKRPNQLQLKKAQQLITITLTITLIIKKVKMKVKIDFVQVKIYKIF